MKTFNGNIPAPLHAICDIFFTKLGFRFFLQPYQVIKSKP